MSETVTHLTRRCPQCGRPLPPDAPEGLCASCLLTAGAETLTGTNETASTDGPLNDLRRLNTPRLVDGQRWGPYHIIRLLGRGGMGEVYEAEQLDTGRRLALKVLRDLLQGAEDRARFIREGQLAASISHAHTVYIFGSEEIGGAPAITMELLTGGTLKDRVAADGPMPSSAAVSAVLQVIGGLDAAQAAGILHRDIKPSNCFVDADGAVKVGDFGLSISTLTRDVRHDMASTGFEGTPHFAAPEQLRGDPLDVRADIYAVGATLYYLLTGRPPLDAPDFRALVSKVTSETPASPRALRRDIPRRLASVVLRCLAKSPAARPQSYAELADLLRPFAAEDRVPAPLGTRFVAWMADAVVLGVATWLLGFSGWMAALFGSTTALLQVAAWPWLIGLIYFGVLEGCWNASLGKRLMGLRVTASACRGWWPRIALRTAIFTMPQFLPVVLFANRRVTPSTGYTADSATSGWTWNLPPDVVLSILIAALPWALTALLFATARRRNHWMGVHELLSGTHVVLQTVVRHEITVPARASSVGVDAASTPSMRIGPYVAQRTVGETGSGRLLAGIDPILRRHVWIHEVPAGTPPVTAARRDVSRPGRLYWLAGRRSATENWDAFEAPSGEPFLATPPTSSWPEVQRQLSSLTAELDASVNESQDARFSLVQVWKRADGQLSLVDFSLPESLAPDANQLLHPVELLASVAARAFSPAAEPAAPLSATRLLNRLASKAPPSLAHIRAELARLASIPSRPTRLRRSLPMILAALPIAALVMIVTIMLPMFARSLQRGGNNVLTQRSDMIRWMSWLIDSSANAELRTSEQRAAAEQYVAATFAAELRDPFWTTQAPEMEPFISMKRKVAEIAARYPQVPSDDLARASAILAPQLQQLAAERAAISANVPAGSAALKGLVSSTLLSIPVLFSIACGLLSGLVVPGGLITRAMRHAVVTRDGREIGRVRSVTRFLIAWSPALVGIALVGAPIFEGPRISPDVAIVVGNAAFFVMAAGAAWTIATPGRGPHDRIARTWVVPR